MKIIEYLKSNKWKLIALSLLLMTKSILQVSYFPAPEWQPLAIIGIFLFASLLALIIVSKWEFKLYTLFFVIAFSYFQGFLHLWKIPASEYVIAFEEKYTRSIQLINNDSIFQSARYNDEAGLHLKKINGDTSTLGYNNSTEIAKLIQDSKIVGIEKCDLGLLFMIRCFIGNGYGVFYTSKKNVEIIEQKNRYTINGYEVTGLTHIYGNWYYLSFT